MRRFFFLVFSVSLLTISAFAADSSFASSSLELYNSSTLSWSLSEYDSSQPVYYYARYDTDGTRAYIYAVSLELNARVDEVRHSDNYTDYELCSNNWATIDGTHIYRTRTSWTLQSGGHTIPALSIFPNSTSDYDIAVQFLEYINTPPLPSVSSSFTLPCGNVAYFQVSSGQTVNFKSSYQILSSLFANSTYGYWSDSGQRFGPAAALPTASTSFPIASQDPLYWSPDPQSKNLLGMSKTGLASASCIIGQWYAFYNPAYNSNNTDWTTMDITGATVSITGSFSNIKIYPLEQVVDYQNGSFVGGSNDDYQSYFDGNIGSDGSVSFTNQNGVTDTPVAGGQNLLAPNETAQSLVDKVVGLLQDIISEIKSLFSFGYEAINDLAGLMGVFASAVSGLYTWLPTEVHAALISAVSIAIVIGVFKVFI